MRRLPLLVASLAFASSSTAIEDDKAPILNASDLRDWCRAETEAYFIGQGVTPYNWTASWWDEVDMLHVQGEWRIGRGSVSVKCRIARGARAEYASYEIVGEISAGKPR